MKKIGLLLIALLVFSSEALATYARPNGTTYFQTRSAAKLGLPSDKLDKEFNDLTTYVNNMSLVTNASEWSLHATAPTYVSSTSFYVTGDTTATFAQYRKIKANLTGSYVYTSVSSSSYDGGTSRTTVTVADEVLTNQLSEIYYGIINSTAATNSVPSNIAAGTATTATTATNANNLYDGSAYRAASATPGANTIPVSDSAGKIPESWLKGISGKKMVFFESSCPTGWTQVTTQNDKALRVVSGTGGGSGGSRALSSSAVGGTALSESQGPAHTHNIRQDYSSGGTPGGGYGSGPSGSGYQIFGAAVLYPLYTTSSGSGAPHDHALALSYIDVIICQAP